MALATKKINHLGHLVNKTLEMANGNKYKPKIALLAGDIQVLRCYLQSNRITKDDFNCNYKWVRTINDVRGCDFSEVVVLNGWHKVDIEVIDALEYKIGKSI